MWIPSSEEEIVNAVRSGNLEEGPTFDAKRELGNSNKNKEIAKDIAAMANDGGVLIYGIAEDDHGRPTVLAPITLKGQAERINQIARTGLSEPVSVITTAIQTKDDITLGYLVVMVPSSERAPHMLTAKGDNRYYGRKDKESAPLTEGEVARLYERRQRWAVDCDAFLEATIRKVPIDPHPDLGYLHVFARPVSAHDGFLARASIDRHSANSDLSTLVKKARERCVPLKSIMPEFKPPSLWQYKIDGYLGSMYLAYDNTKPGSADNVLYVYVDFDGTCRLFCGRGVEDSGWSDGEKFADPEVLAWHTARLLAFAGGLCERAGYLGSIDIGVAVTNLKGSQIPTSYGKRYGSLIMQESEYKKTTRASAMELAKDSRSTTSRLLMPLFDTLSHGMLPDPLRDTEVVR